MSFRIDMSTTTDQLSRYHRQMLEQEVLEALAKLRVGELPTEALRAAREQWSGRATACYHSLVHVTEMAHRLVGIGAPVELLGGAVQSVDDSYRHMVLGAQLAYRVDDGQAPAGPAAVVHSLYGTERDPWLAVYKSALALYGFNMTLSIPIFDAAATVTTCDDVADTCHLIASALEEDVPYGWELLAWLTPRLRDDQRRRIEAAIPELMLAFEQICHGSAEALDALAGKEIIVERGGPNLGTLTTTQYAAIYYHTMTEDIFPNLERLGFDPLGAWRKHYRLEHVDAAPGLAVSAVNVAS